ncbi:MAG: HU family DNA-binding protein [Actinomycetota bacterium]
MNKGELIEALAEKAGVTKSDAGGMLEALEGIVVAQLRKDEKVTITGFVSFERVHKAARTARNPQTGAAIQVAAKKDAKVKAGAALRKAVA